MRFRGIVFSVLLLIFIIGFGSAAFPLEYGIWQPMPENGIVAWTNAQAHSGSYSAYLQVDFPTNPRSTYGSDSTEIYVRPLAGIPLLNNLNSMSFWYYRPSGTFGGADDVPPQIDLWLDTNKDGVDDEWLLGQIAYAITSDIWVYVSLEDITWIKAMGGTIYGTGAAGLAAAKVELGSYPVQGFGVQLGSSATRDDERTKEGKYYIDDIEINGELYSFEIPIISNVHIEPENPSCDDRPITVYSTIIDEDSGLDYATLYWKSSGGNVEDTTFTTPVGGQPMYSTIDYPVTSGDHGTIIQYQIKAVDNFGNVQWYPSSSTWETFTYDGSAPVTTLTLGIPNPGDYITSATEISLECTDTISGCDKTYYKIEDGSWNEVTAPYSFDLTGLSDGTYTIYYYSTDNAGNVEGEKSTTVILDNTKPITTDNSDPLLAWRNSDATITLTPTDLGSGVAHTYYCVDETGTCDPTTEGTSVSVTCAADSVCQKYVRYKSVDNVGNTEVAHNSNLIKIDKQKPVTTDNPPTAWQANDVMVTLTPNDGTGSGVASTKYCIYNEGESACTPTEIGISASVTCAADSVCKKYVRYYSTDVVGNIEDIKTSNLVRIDKQKPTTADDSSSTWTNADVTVTLSPSDGSGSGVANTYYCVDTTGICTPSTAGTSVLVTCAADSVCQQYVRYKSVDNVGNTETIKTSKQIRIDKKKPVSVITSPPEHSLFASDFDVSVSDSDEGSGLANCQYKVLSKGVMTRDWTSRTCNDDIILTVGVGEDCRDEGTDTCKIQVKAIDNVGNENIVIERLFSIDWTNPPQILSSGPSGTIQNNWAVLNVETNKPATCKYDTIYKSDYDAMEYTMTTTGNLVHSEMLTGLSDTSYNYYVLCKDTAGNEMLYPASISFDVDTRELFVATIPENKGEYLRTGWNQFFLPSFVLDDSTLEPPYHVEDVLESIEGSYDILYHYDGTQWTSYVLGREVNDLTEFNGGGFPYYVYMNVEGERIEIM